MNPAKEWDFTYPTGRDVEYAEASRSSHILDHNVFLFKEKEGHFSYQHNSRGIIAFISGRFDLRDMNPEWKLQQLAQYFAILECAEKVSGFEHTSNWDISVVITTKDGEYRFVNEIPWKAELDGSGWEVLSATCEGDCDVTDYDNDDADFTEEFVQFDATEVLEITTWFDT